jgi:CHAD domain-containing protein
MGDLAYAVVRRQLAVLRQKEPGTRLGEDPEELHDMRVATRRLRAALDLFVDVLPVRTHAFRDELGWVARVLGDVRDLDVQQEAQEEMAAAVEGWSGPLGAPSDQHPLAALDALLDREREIARAAMLAALDSPRWDRLVRGLAAMVQQGPARRASATRLPAVIGVPELVVARHDAVMKAAKRAKKSGQAPDFHRLRIRCKRLRYSLEFSAELYGGKTSRYVRRLAALQDQLGLLQDNEVAAGRLATLATSQPDLAPATIFVMGVVAQQHRSEMDQLLAALPHEVAKASGKAWQELASLMDDGRTEAVATQPPVRRVLRSVPPPRPELAPASLPSPAPAEADARPEAPPAPVVPFGPA